MMSYPILLATVLVICFEFHGCLAFLLYERLSPDFSGAIDALKPRRQQRHSFFATPSAEQQNPDELLNRAAILREEIRKLEASAAITRETRDAFAITTSSQVFENKDIANSVWTLSYRFTENPESDIDSSEAATNQRSFSGKMKLKFRNDGYTDLISQETIGPSTSSCQIVKAWGWDVELSKDKENDSTDDEEFVLFSVDVALPPLETDTGATNSIQQRYYFQARIQKDSRTEVLSITDGTVTVKRNILQKSNQWAFLSPAGILAQFRYVGGFIAKPATA